MAYAFIHGEVKGSGASVEFKGNGLDLLDLTIQIVGSVVAEVPNRFVRTLSRRFRTKFLMQCRTIWKRRERRLRQRRRKSLLLARR